MYKYEVDIKQNPDRDTIEIYFRTFKNGGKYGFCIEATEEWLLSKMVSMAEGESYTTVAITLDNDA